mgnify:CR=1 FL=1
MPQNTNLNVSPYFDDFDSSKNYNRVLFKPGTPVQARELTTLQSILQGQVEQFGKHIFREGSMVIPGYFKYDNQYTSVKVESTFFGVPVELYFDKLIGLSIRGKTSGITAKVVKVIPSTESVTSNTTLFIKYEKTSDDYLNDQFLDGENLLTLADFTYGSTTITSGSDFATAINSNASSVGSAFSITRGVWFARGAFIEVSPETIILDQYDNAPSYRVGFNVKEEIITAVDDDTLYDNASGFSNFTAPGADRLKITLVLSKKDIDDFQDETFIELQRLENGGTKKIIDKTLYGELAKEFARRTYDESGNYYVTKFDLEAKESLNDRYSVFGAFFTGSKTNEGNTPSKDLMCIRVGPGKAYVKGYECNSYGSHFVDIEKPRTTALVESSAIPFEAGNKIRVNHVLNAAQIKLNAATSDFIDLRSARLASNQSTAAGDSIGRARVYDYKLQNAGYTGDTSVFELYLFDIQTDTKLTINQAHTIALPAVIEGARTGARGYLRSAVSNSTTVTLHQVSGQFVKDEQIKINGTLDGRVITEVTEFSINDVKSVRSTAASRTFAADIVLESKKDLTGRSFSITSGGVVTSGTTGWVKNFKVGDVISYKRGGQTDVTFNVVSAISPTNNNITVVAAPHTISGICHKALPSSTTTVSDLKILAGKMKASKSGFLYAPLPNTNVESVDLTESTISIRVENTGQATNSSGQMDLPTLTGTDLVYSPFDEERYTVVYSTGDVETLTSDQFVLTNGGKGATISGLTASQTNMIVHSTQQKSKVKSKQKQLIREATTVITGSNRNYSGVSTSITDGLTPSGVYGLRVQDREISLGVPDVVSVAAVFESSGTGTPTIPSMTLGSYNGPNANNTDLILGEIGIGKSSGAAVKVLARSGTNAVEVLYKNNNTFKVNEEVTFQESGVRTILASSTPGDKNIRKNFVLDTGQRNEYYDFGRLVRKQDFPEPQGQLKVYFDHYVINSEDSGDLITASSYTKDNFDTVPAFQNIPNTDVVDLRPRVASYSGTKSPFEFESRVFTGGGQAPSVLVSDENINFDYNHYLGRIDRLFINRNGKFTVQQGTPAVKPVEPETISNAFELARIDYKPYVYDATKDVTITFRANRRYTMKDIGKLETRIENLEETTSLSLLEAATESLVITDPTTGLDRFKNGFVVDPFNDFNVADKTVPFLKYDIDDGKLVSRKKKDSIDLLIGSGAIVGTNGTPDLTVDPRYAEDLNSPNIRKTGDLVTLNYEEVIERSQPFATRVENVNPYMMRSWRGNLTLNPESDIFIENEFIIQDDGIGFSNDIIITEESIPDMREQNIQFIGTRLKPGTNHFNMFAGNDMLDIENRTIPKLLEVTPIQGAFQTGETVRGLSVSAQNESQGIDIRFRLAAPNHKDGPFANPTIVYPNNPYTPNVGLSSSYSETTTVLNIDTASLSQTSDANFFGFVTVGMRLVGETSGAEAEISQIRLITDDYGAVIGSYYLPPNFVKNGTNTALLTSLLPSDQVPALNFSRAAADHFSEGTLITETSLERVEPAPPVIPPPVIIEITEIIDNTVTIIQPILTEFESDDDPLAQTFQVEESPGIFMTSVDMFFQSRSETIPLQLTVVDVVNGYPSRNVVKNGLVILDPDQVNVSEDASVPTKFTFKSPIYLPTGEYAFVTATATSEYNQWICQIGEADITTSTESELGKVIVTKQPTIGSLFKGQTAGTWTPSQLEDMKYVSYKAKFVLDPGTLRMYNPQLNNFDSRNDLPENPIETYAKRVTVGLTSSIATTGADVGSVITQTSNASARGVVADKLAHLGQAANTLSVTNAGTGYEDNTYDPVNFVTSTGSGSGAVGVVTVSSGAITGATVKGDNTGTGYQVGDTLTAALGSKGLGQNLVLTVGVTTAANSLILTNCEGTFDTTNTIISDGVTLPNIKPSTVVTNTDQYDGLHFRVTHPNHGNHSISNRVDIDNITGDSVPTKLTVGYAQSVTSSVSVGSSLGFNFFEGAQVSASNPGYALIGDEIIKYTTVGTNQLTGTITRGVDDSFAKTHEIDTPVQKYELSGVSLRKINTEHALTNATSSIQDNITLDSYVVKLTGSTVFTKDKNGGGNRGRASANIQFESLEPNIAHSLPEGTSIDATVRTTAATSVSGNETSFSDKGYSPVSLVGKTTFPDPRMVASKVNEDAQMTALPGSKSFTFDMVFSTDDENVSPVVDVFKSSVLTESSRVNSPVENYSTDSRVNTLDDPHNNLYLTKVIKLENPATSLKVLFAAFRPASADIRVLYRLQRSDSDEIDKVFELFPGFQNLDTNGNVIAPANNNGQADTKIAASLEDQFLEYEYSVDDLPQFTGFQIKVVLSSVNQAEDPELLDFRSIAVA